MKIWIDAMWAENWPEAVISAVNWISKIYPDIEFVIFWNQQKLDEILPHDNLYEIIESKEDISMNEKSPSRACLKYKGSSMRLWLDSLNNNLIDAFVSNWNTWALVAWAANSKILWTLDKDVFPALTVTLPQTDGSETLFLDVWANQNQDIDVNVENAIMASQYVMDVWWVSKPKIGYLNIWHEDNKWNKIDKGTLVALREYLWDFNEISNIEPNILTNSWCDIILTNWIRWNQILKTAEWLLSSFWEELKRNLSKNLYTKFIALIAKWILKNTFQTFDPSSRWGAILLWVNWIIIKSHWSAKQDSIEWAILQAIRYVEQQDKYDILWATKKALHEYRTSLKVD